MNCNGQSKGAVVWFGAVILIAGYFIVRQVMPQRYTPLGAGWVCEECDYGFAAPVQSETRDCPECGGEAVRSYLCYDMAREELIELYREKPHPQADPEYPDPRADRIIKVPGGEWREVDPMIEIEYVFPVPVERPEDLMSAPPGSDYR